MRRLVTQQPIINRKNGLQYVVESWAETQYVCFEQNSTGNALHFRSKNIKKLRLWEFTINYPSEASGVK